MKIAHKEKSVVSSAAAGNHTITRYVWLQLIVRLLAVSKAWKKIICVFLLFTKISLDCITLLALVQRSFLFYKILVDSFFSVLFFLFFAFLPPPLNFLFIFQVFMSSIFLSFLYHLCLFSISLAFIY